MWSFPRFPFSIFDTSEEEGWLQEFSDLSGLSVAEDADHIYVEAAVPGVSEEEIEMTFDNGVLWIKAERKEEGTSSKKFYRKAINSFSYRVALPGDVDPVRQPEALFKNGILKITFYKIKQSQPKKIPIKRG